MFTVYIISNPEGIFYNGVSSNVLHRLWEHNNNKSRFTSGKGPWEIVYQAEFAKLSDALIEEKRIKRLNKDSLQRLIDKNTR
jgi:putative endonuclease